MTNIDDLKSDWKSLQKPERSAEGQADTTTLVKEFKQIQRKTRKENSIMTVLFILTTTFLWTMFFFMNDTSWWTICGLIIITFEMMAYTAFAWFRNLLGNRGGLQHNSLQYLHSAIKKLKYRKILMVYVAPIYAMLLITGLNLAYVDILRDVNLKLRWLIHLGLSTAMAGFFYYTIKRKLKKERREIDPLIEELQAIKKSLGKEDQQA